MNSSQCQHVDESSSHICRKCSSTSSLGSSPSHQDLTSQLAEREGLQVELNQTDEFFMREAIIEAQKAASLGEVPIGAVVVYKGEIISRAHNTRECDSNPAGHAEFSALMEASRILGRWRLSGCSVYVSLEPCLMCAGLMINARVDACIYGAQDPKGGALGSLYQLNTDARLNHSFELRSGVLADECAALLSEFFSGLRKKKKALREVEAKRKHP